MFKWIGILLLLCFLYVGIWGLDTKLIECKPFIMEWLKTDAYDDVNAAKEKIDDFSDEVKERANNVQEAVTEEK